MSIYVELLFLISFAFSLIEGNIFLFGNQPLEITTLKYFGNIEFNALQQNLHNPKIVVFKGSLTELSNLSRTLFAEKHTAYVPNGHIDIRDKIELGSQDADEIIKDHLNNLENDNYLGVIIDEAIRRRREEVITDDDDNDDEEQEEDKNISQPIFYTSDDGQIVVYSSKSPVLKVNSTKYNLATPSFVSSDTRDGRDTYTRLIVTIPFEDKDKLAVGFKFQWRSGYWSIKLIQLQYSDSRKYNLTLNKELIAARNFSYHCAGETTFKDIDNGLELTLYDLQAQPDAKNGKFNDAYDCIPFTTVPIWSGILVVSFLTIVLAIGLTALGNIKITHGCENIKLKELCIAVGNE